MADTAARRSSPWIATTVRLMTFTQLVKMVKQSTTRMGSKSASGAIVARDPRADKWMALSSDVWTIQEMHRMSKKVVRWSERLV